jgi:hypothetical protein
MRNWKRFSIFIANEKFHDSGFDIGTAKYQTDSIRLFFEMSIITDS